MIDKEWELRKDICEISRRLYMAGFMSGSDGNISTILNENEILITPSRLSKGFMEPEQMVKVDRQGNQLSGDLPPTSETALHLAVYEERADICSVVHCHPPILVAFTVAGIKLPSRILPEVETIFGGNFQVAPYATPGGSDFADSVRPFIRDRSTSVVLLDHHGIVGVGNDVYQASIKVEHAEAAARVLYYARQLGHEIPLPPDSVGKLRKVHERLVEMEDQVYSRYCHSPECEIQNKTQGNNGGSGQDIDKIVGKVTAYLNSERN